MSGVEIHEGQVGQDRLELAKTARRAARRALVAYERAPSPETTRGMADAVIWAERACSDLVTFEPERWHEYIDWAFSEDN